MATASTSSIFSQTAAAGIQAWTGELFGELIACGLTQTNDTGQLAITGSGGTATTNAAQPTGVGVANAVGFCTFTFNDALAQCALSTTALNSGGSGYTNNSYTGLTVTGATSGATSALASCTVSGGVAGNLTITTAGSGYIIGEKLTVSGIGAGTGANWTATAGTGGSPVIIRLDVGANSVVTDPALWITVGQGTNGAGVISGSAGTTKMTQVMCGIGSAPASTVTAYTSYYSYNSTLGTCLVAMKYGGMTASCYALAFYIHRSNNTSGAPTGTSVSLYAASNSTSPPSVSYTCGVQQTLAYAAATVYPAIGTSGNGTQWAMIPQNANGTQVFGLTSTLENSTVFIFNVLYMNPGFSYSAFMGAALNADISNGVAVTSTLVGTQSVTLLALQYMFGLTDSPFQTAGINMLCVYQ